MRCVAVYTLFDGVGARISGKVLGYTAMMSIFSGIPLMAVAFFMRGGETVDFLRRDTTSRLSIITKGEQQ